MRYCITIKGRVQGVYFRQHTAERAVELGITGFVQNLPDGSVYCEAEGSFDNLQHFLDWCGIDFLDWCGIGSPMSDVKSVDVEMTEKMGFVVFEVRK